MNKSFMRITCIALASLLSLPIFAQRTQESINSDWNFRQSEKDTWQSVNLPHTWSTDAYEKIKYYRGDGFYHRDLNVDVKPGRRYFLHCEGASKVADIQLNGQQVGIHKGGYTAFTYDITSLLKDKNSLDIRVNNLAEDVTPLSADFTFWGGIYRDVWLISTPEQHFDMSNYGSDGIFVSTPVATAENGQFHICGKVTNDGAQKSSLIVLNRIFDPQGNLLELIGQKVIVKPRETLAFECTSKNISQPQLWTPDQPNLYRIETTLVDKKTGIELDKQQHKMGFRWFSFDGKKGFYLNGKHLKLRGANRHQDQWPVGVALDDEAHRRDIRLMKELGCNFIRIAHYPQDNALLEACDELGILAWEEIPIVNYVPENNAEYNDNCEYNLREMIRQHYNHTCVIAWGYMNEILLSARQFGEDGWPALKDRTVALAQRLEKVLKEEDSTRVSVMAFSMDERYNTIGLNLVDVTGWNLYHGWYTGNLTDFDKWMNDQQARYPNQPVILSEWGAGSDLRIHSRQPKRFDFSIEYQQEYVEHYLPFIEKNDFISGCTYWNFIDFNVAARQESMPHVNNKGIVTNSRHPKDVYYYFQSMWRQDKPVVHIASRDWACRTGAASQLQTIKVYTNLQDVELIVNGMSQGCKKADNCMALFEIPLTEGFNTLIAKGTSNGKEVLDAMELRYNLLPDLDKGEELAINVGSNCDYTSDITGLTWLADKPYSTGSWGYLDGEEKTTTSTITCTQDGPIFQAWREGLTNYRIDAPAGQYEVEILTANDKHQSSRTKFIVENTEGYLLVAAPTIDGKTQMAGIHIRKQ